MRAYTTAASLAVISCGTGTQVRVEKPELRRGVTLTAANWQDLRNGEHDAVVDNPKADVTRFAETTT